MRVYLMRHATAEEPGAGPDAARRLTEQGRRESREAGDALRKQTSNLAVVLTSPRLRARETAEEIIAAIGGIARVEVRERLTCGATAADYLDAIQSERSGEVLVVGHNPELSAFATALVSQPVSFRPSTICGVDLEDDSARLV